MKLSGIDFKVYIRRCLIHVPVGIGIGFVTIANATLGVLMALYFILYQLNEDENIKDFAYPDIAGAIWGIIIYVAVQKGIALWH